MMENLVKLQYFEQYQAPDNNNQHNLLLHHQPHSDLPKIQHIETPWITSNKLLSERKARIKKDHISQNFQSLLDKYFISISEKEFEEFVEKAVRLRTTLIYHKIDSEFVPAVFYYFYVDRIGIYNTKDFCKRNGLNAKKFNKKYIACVSFFKKQVEYSTKCENQSNQCKFSDGQQDYTKKQRTLEKNLFVSSGIAIKKAQKIDQNMSPLDAIDLIYDFVFKNEYFQDNRRQIILKIVQKYEQTNPKLIEAIDWTDKPILKIYYVMIFYFRMYGAPFTFTQVKEIVFEKFKLSLTREGYYAINRLFKKFDKNQQSQECCGSAQKQDQKLKFQ